LKKGINRGKWSEAEEHMLVEGYNKYGEKWRKISDLIGTRDNMQIFHHFKKLKYFSTTTNYFNEGQPVHVSGTWAQMETIKLLEGVDLYGKLQYEKIAAHIGTRNSNQVMHHLKYHNQTWKLNKERKLGQKCKS
jgi:hypothetical protein